MSEIDLIPADYRLDRRRESAFGRLAVVAGAVLLGGLLAAGGLAWATGRVHAQLGALELARRTSDQERVELANLQGERARLEQQWARLQALRGDDDVGALFLLIDRTLPAGELWFDRWELRRAEGVRIVGQARDHGALSRFVRGLYESQEVQDVHLERTLLRRYTTTSVIAFELAILLKGSA